ncbi:hypothetical protein GN958_ATG18536 [Phytophthora infestans]|uniref:Uncharacterized protein n=1 Tax=Phytophthora infestans TaxID=4787 RepID=A0A8S9U039_PHYIN|nr:hypothetical protein GN958_ATG23749 [Phytophthora infestans]KAF4132274.1 hypothetical protein GN958_ATG18536 [Phytophthora infestans]
MAPANSLHRWARRPTHISCFISLPAENPSLRRAPVVPHRWARIPCTSIAFSARPHNNGPHRWVRCPYTSFRFRQDLHNSGLHRWARHPDTSFHHRQGSAFADELSTSGKAQPSNRRSRRPRLLSTYGKAQPSPRVITPVHFTSASGKAQPTPLKERYPHPLTPFLTDNFIVRHHALQLPSWAVPTYSLFSYVPASSDTPHLSSWLQPVLTSS